MNGIDVTAMVALRTEQYVLRFNGKMIYTNLSMFNTTKLSIAV
jgi:hypothetical protein